MTGAVRHGAPIRTGRPACARFLTMFDRSVRRLFSAAPESQTGSLVTAGGRAEQREPASRAPVDQRAQRRCVLFQPAALARELVGQAALVDRLPVLALPCRDGTRVQRREA